MEEKIAALLRKAERTDNPHEAEAYSKKAEALMVKLGIEEAVIRAKMDGQEQGSNAKIVQKIVSFRGSYNQAQQRMACYIGEGLGLRTLVGKSWDGKVRNAYLIGYEKDVERADILIASLTLQCATAQKRWWRDFEDKQWMTGMEKFKARRQFIISFGSTVGRRLAAQREEIVSESTGTDLVLVDQHRKINDWIANEYGQLRETRSQMHGSHAGRMAGSAAGAKASLGGTQVGGNRKALS